MTGDLDRYAGMSDRVRGSVSFPVPTTEPVDAAEPRRIPAGLADQQPTGQLPPIGATVHNRGGGTGIVEPARVRPGTTDARRGDR